jgi:NAD(P)-dependent dehydrogenase (short-subunit alcohol dehydrogenase family)
MGRQLGRHGVRVNAVAPAILDTAMVRSGLARPFDAQVESAALHTLLGCLGNLRMSLP